MNRSRLAISSSNNAGIEQETGSDSDIDIITHSNHPSNHHLQEQDLVMSSDNEVLGPGGLMPLSNDELVARIEDVQNATTSRELLVFLNSLRIDNSKTGISLSWNRALKVLKLHNIISSDYKPYSQLRSGEKLEITARLNSVQDDVIINDLRTAILEGFVQDTRYPRKRKVKWQQVANPDEHSSSSSVLMNAATEHDPSIASQFAMIVNSAEQEDGELTEAAVKKIKTGKGGPNSAKEAELLLEKIKNVRVERLQKAINDQVTWNLLTQEVRDGVLAEYAKLLRP